MATRKKYYVESECKTNCEAPCIVKTEPLNDPRNQETYVYYCESNAKSKPNAGPNNSKKINDEIARVIEKIKKIQEMIKQMEEKRDYHAIEDLNYELAALQNELKSLQNQKNVGGKITKSKSKPTKSTYSRTTRKHTDKSGKTRTIYTKGGKEYVQRRSKKTGKVRYELVKSH